MKDAPAFDFYPSDWLSGTILMSYEEKGLYLELLAMQWEEGALPGDDQLKRLRVKRKNLDAILEKFPLGVDGLRRNLRLERERVKQRARRAKNIDKARRAAGVRWSEPDATGIPQASSEHSASIPQAMPESCPPITHHPSPITIPSTSVEGGAGGTAIAAPANAVKKSRKSEPITDEYLDELQGKYPWVQVRQEFTKAYTWTMANNRICSRPFFVNWINRAQPPPTAKPINKPNQPAFSSCGGLYSSI